MPRARVTVARVSDEGAEVVVWGRLDRAPNESEPVGFVFRAKGDRSDIELAERASRLGSGTEVAIDYVPVANGWNLACGLLPPP